MESHASYTEVGRVSQIELNGSGRIVPIGDAMLPNSVYNIMQQITVESQSLKRIKNDYIDDAKDDRELTQYWKELEKDKETHIDDLQKLLEKYLE